jgi:hypothetical protein
LAHLRQLLAEAAAARDRLTLVVSHEELGVRATAELLLGL